MPAALKIVLLVLVTGAAIYDLLYRRIPNWLNVAGLLLGVAANTWFFAAHGFGSSLLGAACALAVYVPLYFIKGMGAGDVKLMAAVGAVAGPLNWLAIFFATALLGGIASAALVVSRRRVVETAANLSTILEELSSGRAPAARDPKLDIRDGNALRLPHGVIIASGCALFLAFGSRLLTPGG